MDVGARIDHRQYQAGSSGLVWKQPCITLGPFRAASQGSAGRTIRGARVALVHELPERLRAAG